MLSKSSLVKKYPCKIPPFEFLHGITRSNALCDYIDFYDPFI